MSFVLKDKSSGMRTRRPSSGQGIQLGRENNKAGSGKVDAELIGDSET